MLHLIKTKRGKKYPQYSDQNINGDPNFLEDQDNYQLLYIYKYIYEIFVWSSLQGWRNEWIMIYCS
jgi:hypothetical protein